MPCRPQAKGLTVRTQILAVFSWGRRPVIPCLGSVTTSQLFASGAAGDTPRREPASPRAKQCRKHSSNTISSLSQPPYFFCCFAPLCLATSPRREARNPECCGKSKRAPRPLPDTTD
uniref:Secreted protein n=1 Tax=Panagrellus redivivus TaxID=6233 RepID=A0A7E4VQ69_PANRE